MRSGAAKLARLGATYLEGRRPSDNRRVRPEILSVVSTTSFGRASFAYGNRRRTLDRTAEAGRGGGGGGQGGAGATGSLSVVAEFLDARLCSTFKGRPLVAAGWVESFVPFTQRTAEGAPASQQVSTLSRAVGCKITVVKCYALGRFPSAACLPQYACSNSRHHFRRRDVSASVGCRLTTGHCPFTADLWLVIGFAAPNIVTGVACHRHDRRVQGC